MVGEMAQWAKALAMKPDSLILVPRTHMVDKNKKPPVCCPLTSHVQGVFTPLKQCSLIFVFPEEGAHLAGRNDRLVLNSPIHLLLLLEFCDRGVYYALL